MKIGIVGGGPSGLFLAYLMKRSDPARVIRVIEQNPADATFGFGVVLSGRAIDFLAQGGTEVVDRIMAKAESWTGQVISVDGRRLFVDGGIYSGIERLTLLTLLREMSSAIGVEIHYRARIDDPGELADCDLIVGADGANSTVRGWQAEQFGTRFHDLENFFAWYGVETPYPCHQLSFIQRDGGVFCGHHYRFTPGMSTFVAECDAESWTRTGMADWDDDRRRHYIQDVYAEVLDGRPLISNRSHWKNWRLVTNERWHCGRLVLIGDALRSAHPSIGSGTRLAMEDAVALWAALEATGDDIPAALDSYQQARRPIREKLNNAGLLSIRWYEQMRQKLALKPYDFAYDYLMRTGRMTPSRLTREAAGFMGNYQAWIESGREIFMD